MGKQFIIILFTIFTAYKFVKSVPAIFRRVESHNIGVSPGYVRAAAELLSGINRKINPCYDFFEYACGKWIEEHPIPDDLVGYGVLIVLHERITIQMRRLLEKKSVSQSKVINLAKKFYNGCMDKDRLSSTRGAELVKSIEELGYWPVVHNTTWTSENFDLTEILIKLAKTRAVDVFVEVSVSTDEKNASRKILKIDQGNLGMGGNSRGFFLDKNKYIKQLNAYRKLMVDKIMLVARDAGHPKHVGDITTEIDKMLEFEVQLAEIMSSPEQRRDTERQYNLHKLSDLKYLFKQIDFEKYLKSIVPQDVLQHIESNPDININEVEYLKKLDSLLMRSDKRVIANYIMWIHSFGWQTQLDDRYEDVHDNFLREFIGKQSRSPRYKICVQTTTRKLKYATGALFVRKYFPELTKRAADSMVNGLKSAFDEILLEVPWMDTETKQKALKKSIEMQQMIGYSDIAVDDDKLDDYYKELEIGNDTYPTIFGKISLWSQDRNFRELLKPNDRTEFSISSSVVNAFYDQVKNAIVFPAAILQFPLFDHTFPAVVNYGAIGSIIGHEITHGFDDQGRKFDELGNLNDWWGNRTKKHYKNHTECFVKQYGNYEVPETNHHLNGELTQGENIADNGGFRQAYKAYRKYVENLGHEEKRLPGLEDLTNDQIFFLSFARNFCGHSRPEAIVRQILVDPHAPYRFRVNGVVSNQEDFAKVFNCPRGTPMNPEIRCHLW